MYEKFFGLADEPFRLTPDPRYLFLSHQHAEVLAHLRLGLTESSGFVCITGEVGTGKTTLLRAFLSELGPNVVAAYTHVPPLSALELLRRICREFGLPATGQARGDLVEELHALLAAQGDSGRVYVVVLDEAQALSAELLEQIRLLLNLETATRKLLRIVLVGQPQLRKLLLDPGLAQLNQRITLRWHLGPLSHRETVAYVSHRLSVAGGSPQLFTRPALRLLHSVSQGVPRLVNMVAHRALLAAFVAREPRVSRRFVARAYREIQAVPLPGTLSLLRKVGWAAGGLAIGAGLFAFGIGPVGRLLDGAVSSPSEARRADAREGSPPSRPAADPPPAPPAPPGADARVVSTGAAPPTGANLMPAAAEEQVARRLAALQPEESARAATAAILAVWGERGLDEQESHLPADLDVVASRRGLHEVHLKSNRSMLRLLDLPAVVVLRAPSSTAPRFAALTSMDGTRVVLTLAGESTAVDPEVFDRLWSGEAFILWRDFEGLGRPLQRDARGVAVVRLQRLLHDAGLLDTVPSGQFDPATVQAVRRFQRAHRLDEDGVVGPLTRIVLYGSVGHTERPRLASGPKAAS